MKPQHMNPASVKVTPDAPLGLQKAGLMLLILTSAKHTGTFVTEKKRGAGTAYSHGDL